MNAKIIVLSIIGGIIVTLLTGLVSNTPQMLVGATHYGYPLAWLIRMVVGPEYYPWRVEILNLIIDIVVWTVIVGVFLMLLSRKKKSN